MWLKSPSTDTAYGRPPTNGIFQAEEKRAKSRRGGCRSPRAQSLTMATGLLPATDHRIADDLVVVG